MILNGNDIIYHRIFIIKIHDLIYDIFLEYIIDSMYIYIHIHIGVGQNVSPMVWDHIFKYMFSIHHLVIRVRIFDLYPHTYMMQYLFILVSTCYIYLSIYLYIYTHVCNVCMCMCIYINTCV